MPANTSPTARILRSSRFFSLPPPIPAPESDLSSLYFKSASSTATQIFPTRQAIVTKPSSLYRNDWGLKRPLPEKIKKQSSAPTIRMIVADTKVEITEFESAGDHVRTLEKLQELNLALMTPRVSVSGSERLSVFEPEVDKVKDEEDDEKGASVFETSDGKPISLENLGEEDFDRYLWEKVDKERDEFVAYLQQLFQRRLAYWKRNRASGAGDGFSQAGKQKESKEGMAEFIKFTREHDPQSLNLKEIAMNYFNRVSGNTQSDGASRFNDSLLNARESKDDSVLHTFHIDTEAKINTHLHNNGDRIVDRHPSMGISYNRSNAYIELHPEIGPMLHHTPAPARLLIPRQLYKRTRRYPVVGIAGVAANGPNWSSHKEIQNDPTSKLDAETHGGAKVHAFVKTASVDARGRLKLELQAADPVLAALRDGKPPPAPSTASTKGFSSSSAALGWAPGTKEMVKGRLSEPLDQIGSSRSPRLGRNAPPHSYSPSISPHQATSSAPPRRFPSTLPSITGESTAKKTMSAEDSEAQQKALHERLTGMMNSRWKG